MSLRQSEQWEISVRLERPRLPSQSSADRFTPDGVIGHARQFREMDRRQFAQAAHHRVEDGAQDARPVGLKRLPKLVLAAAVGARNRRQTHEDAAIFQIGPTDEIADPAQEHGALGVNKAPIVVGKESAAGDGSSEDKLAKGVRQPAGDITSKRRMDRLYIRVPVVSNGSV